jgi:NAD(P)-dependent dehydrogenase (short-subunit alcohol dehydrogenase family)
VAASVDSTRVAVVTGAATGIGRAIAIRLAQDGYDIVLAGLEPTDLNGTARLVEETGRSAIALETDVRDDRALRAVSSAAADFGGAAVLVNNAAIYPTNPWDQITEYEWDNVLAVNLKGAFLSCRALGEQLRTTGGCIVNISSNTAFRGWSGLLHYVSS